MEPLDTHVDKSSKEFKSNRENLQKLVEELNQKLAKARQGGGEKYLARLKEQGKFRAREDRRHFSILIRRFSSCRLSPPMVMYDDEATRGGDHHRRRPHSAALSASSSPTGRGP